MFFKEKAGGASWLLVCLGNPGDKYENTRHNVGFMVADELAERQRAPIQKLKFKALTNLFTISGEKVLVMKPITYMNVTLGIIWSFQAFDIVYKLTGFGIRQCGEQLLTCVVRQIHEHVGRKIFGQNDEVCLRIPLRHARSKVVDLSRADQFADFGGGGVSVTEGVYRFHKRCILLS